jgi:hypothetical protein
VAQHFEVIYAHQTRPSRSKLLSSQVASASAVSLPKLTSSVAIE